MSLKPNYNFKAIKDQIRKSRENIEKYVIRGILEIAEETVNRARTMYGYDVKTGNLRNSIGYAVYYKNKPIQENFKIVSVDIDNQKGYLNAIEIAKSNIPDSSNSIQLIVVAGANYAFFVETKGFDVLSNSCGYAANEITKMLSELKKQIDKNGKQ